MSGTNVPSDALCISVTFLTGRYHGEEWPPSPARLYQALVAAVMTCGYQEFETVTIWTLSPGSGSRAGTRIRRR